MTADADRALRHSGAKCVPREPDEAMVSAAPPAVLPEDVWLRMFDAAPPCECECERLLRELAVAIDTLAVGRLPERVSNAMTAARAYLARSKP
jgi:hypothetical protein